MFPCILKQKKKLCFLQAVFRRKGAFFQLKKVCEHAYLSDSGGQSLRLKPTCDATEIMVGTDLYCYDQKATKGPVHNSRMHKVFPLSEH